MAGKIIATIGCPATGKTYLADRLGEYYCAEVIREAPESGFPPEIKENLATQENLFETIVWFRNHQIRNYNKALGLKAEGNMVVMDTTFYLNQLYVNHYVQDLFKRQILYELGNQDLDNYPQPDCTIFIDAKSEDIISFLQKRSGQREWENPQWIRFINSMAPLARDYIIGISPRIQNLITIERSTHDFSLSHDFDALVKQVNGLIQYP